MKQILIHELGHANVYEALGYESIITVVPSTRYFMTTFLSVPDVTVLDHNENLLTAGIAGTVAEDFCGYYPHLNAEDYQAMFSILQERYQALGQPFPCPDFYDLMNGNRGLLRSYEAKARHILEGIGCSELERQADEIIRQASDAFTVTLTGGLKVDSGADAVRHFV